MFDLTSLHQSSHWDCSWVTDVIKPVRKYNREEELHVDYYSLLFLFQKWVRDSWFTSYICNNNCSLKPCWFIGTWLVSKEAACQGHFCVTKYNRGNYIALNLPYYYQFSFFCSSMGRHRDHLLIHSLFTICKMGIDIWIWNVATSWNKNVYVQKGIQSLQLKNNTCNLH